MQICVVRMMQIGWRVWREHARLAYKTFFAQVKILNSHDTMLTPASNLEGKKRMLHFWCVRNLSLYFFYKASAFLYPINLQCTTQATPTIFLV